MPIAEFDMAKLTKMRREIAAVLFSRRKIQYVSREMLIAIRNPRPPMVGVPLFFMCHLGPPS
jgi:hypothetical protein